MLKNYLKTSLRNLKRNKRYAFINIGGLAIGVFSFVMIMLLCREYSYDGFYPKADRIYRIGVDGIIENTEIKQVYTPAPLPEAIYKSFPQAEAVTRVDTSVQWILGLTTGRLWPILFFSDDFDSDITAIVINEATLHAISWQDDIDKIIKIWIGGGTDYNVIGVVEDFHYESKHQDVRPMAVVMRDRFNWSANYISLRLKTVNARNVINQVEAKWREMAGELPLSYSFLDENYDNLYRNEAQTRNIFAVFSILSIFVASLGLFALASFIAERRTKEIGIRKSLGASTGNITRIFLTGFVKWVFIAGLVAIPLAFISMKQWLQNFAYRISLTWEAFVVAIVIAVAIAVFTLLYLPAS